MNQLNQSNIPQQPQPSFQPEASQKRGLLTWAIVLIAIAVVGLVSYGAYRYFTSPPPELPVSEEETTSSPTWEEPTPDKVTPISEKIIHKILFTHMEKGESVWLVNDDGTDLKQIIGEKEVDNAQSVVLSSKGDKVAYESLEESEKIGSLRSFGIRILDLATNKSTLLISYDRDEANLGQPKFSPDGNDLAYFIEKDSQRILYVTNLTSLATNKVIEITSVYEVFIVHIDWSPDGKKITYVYDNDIYITDLSGNIQKIVSGGDPIEEQDLGGNKYKIFTVSGPLFSADGNWITYMKITNSEGSSADEKIANLFMVDINGKNDKQLTNFKPDKNKYIRVGRLIPNSNKVLVLEFWPKGHDPYMQKLLLHDIDSKETEVIYEGDKYYNPRISPDGKLLAVSIFEDEGGIYSMNLNGENLKRITSISGAVLEWK